MHLPKILRDYAVKEKQWKIVRKIASIFDKSSRQSLSGAFLYPYIIKRCAECIRWAGLRQTLLDHKIQKVRKR